MFGDTMTTMIFYHGTTKKNWESIQKEGVLWGRRFIIDNKGKPIKEVDRCTYLAVDKEEAEQFGDVVLKVEYNPFNNPKDNNYIEDCWQVRVYEPIPLTDVERIK